ncbi:MAG TPA: cellulase family glycosylhydrolase [Bryobacteraceae bacterium]|nr:cellulase family glycosylhydrolase [Bryobacteraceae bacterium]
MKYSAALLLFLMAASLFGQYSRGVNLAGAEFGENNLPGTLGHDYTFNSETTYRYFSAKNLNLIRLMLRWERLQPVLRGPLDANYLAGVKNNVAWAKAHGDRVVLDIHNYGRYKITENGVLTTYTLDNSYGGVVKVSGADLADLWAKVAVEFRDEPAVYAYDLMNEPHDMGSASWKNISQAALMAIRSTGDHKLIMVPGDNWSSAEQWARTHGPTSWIADPALNFAYEAHQYFDRDSSGTYALTYDQELALNPNLATSGAARVAPFINWLTGNNVRGYVGEYGIPNTDVRWLAVLDSVLGALDAAGLDGTYWAAGEWWGDYQLSVQPANNFATDRPQLAVLGGHLTPGSFTTVSAASSSGFVFAPDSLVSGYASGMSPAATVDLVDASGGKTSAPVLYASASQVNYLVPATVTPSRLTVFVRDGERIVAQGSLELDRVAPAFFSANGDGRGVAAAQIVRVKSSGAQSYEAVAQFDAGQNRFVPAPIDFGDPTDRLFLLLYGTGFRNASTATLRVGTTTVPLQYAGKQPQFPGLDQANAELPRTLIGAGNVVLAFTADGKAANPVTLLFR